MNVGAGPSPSNSSSSPDEEEFLRSYDESRYALPSVTVDVCALAVLDSDLKALVVRRHTPPFDGAFALPGTFVRVAPARGPNPTNIPDESLEEACARVLAEKAGISGGPDTFHQLMTVGPIDRDPRARVVSVVHFVGVAPEAAAYLRATADRDAVQWLSFTALAPPQTPSPLAFDHAEILLAVRERLIRRLALPALAPALALAPETFTLAELRAVYEAVLGTPLDASNFRRRFNAWEAAGDVVLAEGSRVTGRRRAKVYRGTASGGSNS